MKIKLAEIQSAVKPIRRNRDQDKLDELVASIKKRGVVVPPKIKPNGKGYRIVYGHRRIEAARLAGLTEIECLVEGMDDKKATAESWIENMLRESMSAYDIMDALIEIAKAEGATSAAALSKLGYGASATLAPYWTLQDQPPEVRELFHRQGQSASAKKTPIGVVKAVVEAGLSELKTSPRSPNARIAVLTPEGVAVMKKVASEELNTPQATAIAKSIKATPDPEEKRRLLTTKYASHVHSPEVVRATEQARAHNKTVSRGKRTQTIDWSRTPSVAAMLDLLARWTEKIDTLEAADDLGKLSPEAGRFFAGKLRSFGAKVIGLAIKLEKRHGIK